MGPSLLEVALFIYWDFYVRFLFSSRALVLNACQEEVMPSECHHFLYIYSIYIDPIHEP